MGECYEKIIMMRKGISGAKEYNKRMESEFAQNSFAFYDADETPHTIDFVDCGYGRGRKIMLDEKFLLVNSRDEDITELQMAIERLVWAVCISGAAVLVLGVTVLMHLLK